MQLLTDSVGSNLSRCGHMRWGRLTWAWSRHLWLGGWRWRPPGGWCLPSRACRRRQLQAWCRRYWRPARRCWSGTCGTDTGASCWTGPRCSQSRLSHLGEAGDQGQPQKFLMPPWQLKVIGKCMSFTRRNYGNRLNVARNTCVKYYSSQSYLWQRCYEHREMRWHWQGKHARFHPPSACGTWRRTSSSEPPGLGPGTPQLHVPRLNSTRSPGADTENIKLLTNLFTLILESVSETWCSIWSKLSVKFELLSFSSTEHTLIKSRFYFKVYLFVGEGSNAASLILETGLSSLLNVAHVPQIPHKDSSSSCANDQPISSHREGIHLSKTTSMRQGDTNNAKRPSWYQSRHMQQ